MSVPSGVRAGICRLNWPAAAACILALSAGSASAITTAAKPAVHRHHARSRRAVAGSTPRALTTARARRIVTPGVAHASLVRTSNTRAIVGATHGRLHARHRVFFNPWSEPTYADSTIGDAVDGEDLQVRKAAVDALGPYNGTVIVTDAENGRILSIVNQKLALKGAYQPCSTVKLMVSFASLKEEIVDPFSTLRISRRSSIDLTRALAISNNLYFARLGQQLGFERVHKYGELFGLGEKAGLNIVGEEPGTLATEPPQTGLGMMTSFGDGIRLTPLELTSMVASVANGGTMYYLQYPRSQEDVNNFTPRIKRNLEIADLIPDVKPGMMGAVEYGTARRAGYTNSDEIILGKTGTCTDSAQPGVHLGWFGSFNDFGDRKLVVVVLLTGGRGVSGPIASGIAGNVYHNLTLQSYFTAARQPVVPAALLPSAPPSTQAQ